MVSDNKKIRYSSSDGFTIIELLVVIVVIGILAAITIISYTGVSQRATAVSLQSDITNASNQLKMYYVDNGTYPITNNCNLPKSNINICLKSSAGNSLIYYPGSMTNSQTFGINTGNKSNTRYNISNSSVLVALPTTCPSGFILVPGSTTYNTSDFCIMKYEAKQVGATNVPISQTAGLPWYNLTQASAVSYSQNVAGCVGCHLVTDAEWLTVAQNVMSVASNWSGGSVGSGSIYVGHSDYAPSGSLAASSDDVNGGYFGETNTGGSQRRTLTLTNGQVIWDFAGNVSEWIGGQLTSGGQPGISSDAGGANVGVVKEWKNTTIPGSLSPSPFPSFGNAAASGWTSAQGVGDLVSNGNSALTTVYDRGGSFVGGGWYGGHAGIYALETFYSIGYICNTHGFRVAQ